MNDTEHYMTSGGRSSKASLPDAVNMTVALCDTLNRFVTQASRAATAQKAKRKHLYRQLGIVHADDLATVDSV